MAVRRDRVDGKRTPSGILTRFTTTALGRIVKEIEAQPNPDTIDLGFLLLTLGENTVLETSQAIDKFIKLALQDHGHHDLTIGLDSGSSGLTFHINEEPISIAGPRLQKHCEHRKYSQKAKSWFGVCVAPSTMALRFGVCLQYEWKQSAHMDLNTHDLPRSGNIAQLLSSVGRKHKLGRNDPCLCGSGKKYKKCCL